MHLRQKDALARRGQGVRQGAAAGAAANNDHVMVFGHNTECGGRGRAPHHTFRVTARKVSLLAGMVRVTGACGRQSPEPGDGAAKHL